MKPNATIQYVGLAGVTSSCSDAVARLVQFGDRVKSAKILSRGRTHALLLTTDFEETIAVRAGFASGYRGEGPSGFSSILVLLKEYGVQIEEYDVRPDVLDRIDRSSLTAEDLSELEKAEPVRPIRWYDYIYEEHLRNPREVYACHLPLVMPYALIDTRIMDLALRFFRNPDESLFIGYRRLEDIIRKKTGLVGSNVNVNVLFSNLAWNGLDVNEEKNRRLLFMATYGAYRNPRAHREQESGQISALAEFLLLNHLYMLERDAEPRDRECRDSQMSRP